MCGPTGGRSVRNREKRDPGVLRDPAAAFVPATAVPTTVLQFEVFWPGRVWADHTIGAWFLPPCPAIPDPTAVAFDRVLLGPRWVVAVGACVCVGVFCAAFQKYLEPSWAAGSAGKGHIFSIQAAGLVHCLSTAASDIVHSLLASNLPAPS